jgi:ketopantoate reductase
MIDLGCEVVTIAEGNGVALGAVCSMQPDLWRDAAHGDAHARAAIEAGVESYGIGLDPTARSGSAQDRARNRASEVDFINGAVVREAEKLGRTAPANRALRDELIAVERAAGSRP